MTVNRHRTAIWRRGQLQGSLCQLFWSCVHTNRLLQEGSAREMRSLLAFSDADRQRVAIEDIDGAYSWTYGDLDRHSVFALLLGQ